MQYLLNGADTTAAPQNDITVFDTIHCKKLIVHDADPAAEEIVLGFGDDGAPQIYLSAPANKDANGRKPGILIEVAKDGPFLEMWHQSPKGGTLSLSVSDDSGTIQTSTDDRMDAEDKEFFVGEDLEFLRGAIMSTTAEGSTILLEGKPLETQLRLR
ncbi:MAG: hypothetical protein OXL96_08055 [Candidatus Poribacteria bacterium]|nr:hypothetical protein [Candidatus Poribacteria bacterium]